MKRIVLLFSLPVMIFLVLLLFSFSFQDRVQEKLKTLEKLDKDIIETDANLEIENLFANDLSLATEDFEDITRRVIAQKKFWNEFVNPDLNIVTNHGIKSSSGVNTEINKLLSFLNRTFDSRKVKLGFSNLSEPNFFTPQNQQPKRYGFGFTAYDGFWPSFEKQEANDLLKQAKIIKEMCEFLLDSFDDNENFNLITINEKLLAQRTTSTSGTIFMQKILTPICSEKAAWFNLMSLKFLLLEKHKIADPLSTSCAPLTP